MNTKRNTVLWSILFLLLYTGPPKFRVRDFDASLLGQFDLPVLIQIGVYLFAGVFVFRKVIEKRRHLKICFTQKTAIAFLLTLAFSASISSDPELTLFRTYQFAILFLFAGLFISEFGLSRTFQHLMIGNAVLCALVVAAIPFIQTGILETSETGFPRLRGSAIAETAITGTFLCILLLVRRERGSVPVLAFATLITFFSLSRASWGSALAVVILIVIFRPEVWSLSLSRIVCVISILVLLAVGTRALITPFREPTVEDLSGRTEIWAYTTGIVLTQSPWRGLGYGVASRTLVADIDPNLGSGHSVFVDVFLGGGLIAVGAFLLLNLLMGIDAVWILWSRRDADEFLAAALFIALLMMSTVGGELDAAPFGFTFFCLVWILPSVRGSRTSEAMPSTRISSTLQSIRANPRLPDSSPAPASPADAGSSGN